MAVYFINFAGCTGAGREFPTRETVTVSADEVRLETRVPLLPSFFVTMAGFLLPLCLLVLVLFGWLYGWIPELSDLRAFTQRVVIWMAITWPVTMIVGCASLRRKHLVLPRASITRCQAQAREVVVETADRLLYLTTPTAAEARALAEALRDAPASPVVLRVDYGRESLSDRSGFYHVQPVRVSGEDGVLVICGARMPSPWRGCVALLLMIGSISIALLILTLLPRPFTHWIDTVVILFGMVLGLSICYAVLAARPVDVRRLPIADISDSHALDRYFTFLAPDASVSERRYTLLAPSPEAAERISAFIRGDAETLEEMRCRIDTTQPSPFRRSTPDSAALNGRVSLDEETVSFLGRFGIPHPRAWRLALLLTLAVWALLTVLLWQAQTIYPLERYDRTLLNAGMAAVLAILLVYLPAGSLLRRLFADRITLPRRSVSQVSRLGREVLLTVNSGGAHLRLSLITATEGEAAGLSAELSTPPPQQTIPPPLGEGQG